MAKKLITEEDLRNEITNTRTILRKQPKVKIMIPANPERPGETHYSGFINGVPFAYPYNELVEVPESVAALIEDNARAIRIAEKAEAEYTTGSGKFVGDNGQTDALANARALLGINVNTTEG